MHIHQDAPLERVPWSENTVNTKWFQAERSIGWKFITAQSTEKFHQKPFLLLRILAFFFSLLFVGLVASTFFLYPWFFHFRSTKLIQMALPIHRTDRRAMPPVRIIYHNRSVRRVRLGCISVPEYLSSQANEVNCADLGWQNAKSPLGIFLISCEQNVRVWYCKAYFSYTNRFSSHILFSALNP